MVGQMRLTVPSTGRCASSLSDAALSSDARWRFRMGQTDLDMVGQMRLTVPSTGRCASSLSDASSPSWVQPRLIMVRQTDRTADGRYVISATPPPRPSPASPPPLLHCMHPLLHASSVHSCTFSRQSRKTPRYQHPFRRTFFSARGAPRGTRGGPMWGVASRSSGVGMCGRGWAWLGLRVGRGGASGIRPCLFLVPRQAPSTAQLAPSPPACFTAGTGCVAVSLCLFLLLLLLLLLPRGGGGRGGGRPITITTTTTTTTTHVQAHPSQA